MEVTSSRDVKVFRRDVSEVASVEGSVGVGVVLNSLSDPSVEVMCGGDRFVELGQRYIRCVRCRMV